MVISYLRSLNEKHKNILCIATSTVISLTIAYLTVNSYGYSEVIKIKM